MQALARTFGLTGGIASGKSTVAGMFHQLGAQTIDADRISRDLTRPSSPAYQAIVARFGAEILAPSSEIDRKKLAELVFADSEKLQALNVLLHPVILAETEKRAAGHLQSDPRAVVIVEASLIYEIKVTSRFRKIIVAWCPTEQQIERFMAAKQLPREAAERRLAAQMPAEEKRRHADYVIDTSGSKEDTRRQVEALYPELRRLAEEV